MEARFLNGVLHPGDTSWSDNQGRTLGLGVFETLILRDGAPLYGDLHLERMRSAAKELDLPDSPHVDTLLQDTQTLLRTLGRNDGAIRWTWTAGDGDQAVVTIHWRDIPASVEERRQGVHGHSTPGPMPLAYLKTTSRAPWVVAQRRAEAAVPAPAEAMFVTMSGEILEGSRSNIFARVDGRWVTPPADGRILPGVTRDRLIAWLGQRGMPVEERRIQRSELLEASAVVLTGSLIGTAPLLTLDGRALDNREAGEVSEFRV